MCEMFFAINEESHICFSFIKVSVLLVVLIFVFASYGVQLFGGKLYRCNDLAIKTKVSHYHKQIMTNVFKNVFFSL